MKMVMEVRPGEKELLLALRRAALTITPYPGTAAIQGAMQVTMTEPVPGVRCKAQGRGDTQCEKDAGHGQRHRYGPKTLNPSVQVPLVRAWTRVPEVPIKSGSKTFTLKVGGPCSLLPNPEVGTSVQRTKHGYRVVSIETHPDGRCNVEVIKANDVRSRTVPLARIVYRRPKKGQS